MSNNQSESQIRFIPKDVHPKDLDSRDRLDQYDYYYTYYKNKYGDRTTVLYQCGSFYEFYGVDNEEMKIGCVREMCALLPIRMTCMDKNKPQIRNTRANYLLAGFPTHATAKFVDFLIDHNYLVVVINQAGTADDKTKPNEKLPHYVAEIYSPGTYVSPDSLLDEEDHKYLVQIFVQGYAKKSQAGFQINPDSQSPHYQPMSVGLSAIDVTTGESDFTEVYNSPEDINFALDEVYRYLQTHQPREVLIASHDLQMSSEDLETYLDLRYNCNIRCQIIHNQVPTSYFNPRVQRQFLEKLFPHRASLDVFEYLDLERADSALISYLQLLQYAYEHNETLVRNLAKPIPWTGDRHLLLANNAINQLDLVSNNKFKWGSVFNLINYTSTNMGRRLLKYRLLNPIRDVEEIQARYNLVAMFSQPSQSSDQPLWHEIEKALTGILDFDRLHRRLELGILAPMSCNLLLNSYQQVQDLLELLPTNLLPSSEFPKQLDDYLKYLNNTLDFEETQKYARVEQINDNIFCPGYHQELDQMSEVIRKNHRYLDVMDKMISNMIPNSSRAKKPKTTTKKSPQQSQGASKIVKNYQDKIGYFFTITCNRFKLLMKSLEEQPLIFKVENREFLITPETFEVLNTNRTESHHQITSPDIREISDILVSHESRVKKLIPEIYQGYLANLETTYSPLYSEISRLVARTDVYKSSAKTAQMFNYCQPEVLQPIGESSYLRATKFRHPIIEQLNTRAVYVPHNLQFGQDPTYLGEEESSCSQDDLLDDDDKDENSTQSEISRTTTDSDELSESLFPEVTGMLIYGSNAVGKSSIMKAIGVNLIMAQAGFYVAAERFQYTPYHRILTRILGNDNMFKGLSSFAVEMSELRGILARADAHSLVLGDEICHGTETVSGVAIVTAAIKRLAKANAHYLFATHLHQLPKLEPIQQLTSSGQLGIYHLRVKYDPATHQLIYYRDLRTGPGDPIYGIEVARAMDLDEEFIKDAHVIRKDLMNQSQQVVAWDHPSRYNKKMLLDYCGVCGEKATETHHIKFQSEADGRGFIGHIHKNHLRNLVGLCESCHLKVHHEQLQIKGYLETSTGIHLDFIETDSKHSKLRKQPKRKTN